MSSMTSYRIPRIADQAKTYYMRLAQDEKTRELVTELVVPRLNGKAFIVEKSYFAGYRNRKLPQVADFNAWNKDDPKEMFWSGRTRLLQRASLSVGDRLWSTPPGCGRCSQSLPTPLTTSRSGTTLGRMT